MSKLITASINLSKVDKNLLFTSKSGEKWLNLSVWLNDTPDQFGNDVSIQQKTDKDAPKIYLGNGKYYKAREPEPEQSVNVPPQDDNGLPF